MHGTSLIVCMKLQRHKFLKLTQMIIFEKTLCWVFWRKKGHEMSFEFCNNF